MLINKHIDIIFVFALYIIHLMSAPEGNSLFCFPESLDVSQDEVRGETLRFHTDH